MDRRLLLRAALVQAAGAGAIFLALVVSPLDRGFFEDWGAIVGPLAWIAAAALTGRVLGIAPARLALAAVIGGLASGTASVAGAHGAGLVIGVLVFALVVASVPRPRPVH